MTLSSTRHFDFRGSLSNRTTQKGELGPADILRAIYWIMNHVREVNLTERELRREISQQRFQGLPEYHRTFPSIFHRNIPAQHLWSTSCNLTKRLIFARQGIKIIAGHRSEVLPHFNFSTHFLFSRTHGPNLQSNFKRVCACVRVPLQQAYVYFYPLVPDQPSLLSS